MDSYARALYDFNASQEWELSICSGDVVKITKHVDDNWYEVESNNQHGQVPITFLELLQSASSPTHYVTAIDNFVGADEEQLSFSKGDRIGVIEELDENWKKGELNGTVGLFPICYVEECTTEGDYVEDVVTCPYAVALYDYTANDDGEISFTSGAILYLTADLDSDWLEGTYNGVTGSFPKNHVTVVIPLEQSQQDNSAISTNGNTTITTVALFSFKAEQDYELSFEEGDVITIRQQVDENWVEGEIAGNVGLFPAKYVIPIITESPQVTHSDIDDHKYYDPEDEIPSYYNVEDQNQSEGASGLLQVGNTARALFDFKTDHAEDLQLSEGSLVIVEKIVDSEWVKARNNTGEVGFCPVSYLEPFLYDNCFQYDEVGLSKEAVKESNKVIKPTKQDDYVYENIYESIEDAVSGMHDILQSSSGAVSISETTETKLDENASPVLYKNNLTSDFSRKSQDSQVQNGKDVSVVSSVSAKPLLKPKPDLKPKPILKPKPKLIPPSDTKKTSSNSSQNSTKTGSSSLSQKPAVSWSSSTPRGFTSNKGTAPKSTTDLDAFAALNLDLIAPHTSTAPAKDSSSYNPIYAKPFKQSSSGFKSVKFQTNTVPSSIPRSSTALSGFEQPDNLSHSWTTFDESSISSGFESCNTWSSNYSTSTTSSHDSSVSSIVPFKPAIPSRTIDNNIEIYKRPAPQVPPSQNNSSGVSTNSKKLHSGSLLDSSFDGGSMLPAPFIPVPQTTSDFSENSTSSIDDFSLWENDLTVNSQKPEIVVLRPIGSVVKFEGSERARTPPMPMRHSPVSSAQGSPKLEHARPRPKPRRPVSFQGGNDLIIKNDFKTTTSTQSKVSRSDPRRQTVSFPAKYSSHKPLIQTNSNDDLAAGMDNPAFDVNIGSPEDKNDVSEIPGIADVENQITETKKKLELEIKVVTGMETVLKVIVSDPAKKRQMESKVEDSYEKIQQLNEDLNTLEDEKSFLLSTYDRMDQIKEKIKYLETEIEKQKEVRQSLDLISRANDDPEIKEQLAHVDLDIEEMNEELNHLKGTLQRLIGRPKLTPAQRMAEQRQNVITEIIKTEQDYLNDLELCINFFMEPLKEWKVPDLDWETLFGNMIQVMELSRRFGAQLEQASQNTEKNKEALGQCFLNVSSEMEETYASYCRNHDEAIALLEKYEDNVEIQTALGKCLELIRKYTSCWDLSSMLIKPVQRILKYPLLLNELLKSTSPNHPDRPQLFKATNVMTNVANTINELKRRKDLVMKYQRAEEAGISTKIQKLNWRSVIKKSSRLNQRITQMTGLVSQTVDDTFVEEEKKFKNVEKTIKNFIKNVQCFIEQFQEWSSYQILCAENIKDYYMEKTDCSEVESYQAGQQRITQMLAKELIDELDSQVLSPLNILLGLYQGPHRVIQKRHDKCLDYDSRANKIEKIKDKDKLKVAQDDLQFAKKTYEALNAQLLVDLPSLYTRSLTLFQQCVCNFVVAQRKFHQKALVELQPIVNLSIIDDPSNVDILDEHAKKMQGITDQIALLHFVPIKFGSKEIQKKKAAMMLPSLPSAGLVDSDDPHSDQEGYTRSSSSPTKSSFRSPTRSKSMKKRQAPAPPPIRTSSPTKQGSLLPQANPRPKYKNLSSNNKSDDETSAPSKKEKKSSHGANVKKSAPKDAPQYHVDFAFEGQDPAELSVTEGMIVTVVRQCDTSGNAEWWLIEHSGKSGYIPAGFLSPVNQNTETKDDEDDVITPVASPLYYYAEFPFEASSTAELALTEGKVVIVVQQNDLEGNGEWWLVEADGQRGYVPAAFLAPVD